MNDMVKLSDVAKHAGVSVATASRVVNGSRSASPDTRARVMKAVELLGYEPNQQARNLRTGMDPNFGPTFEIRSQANFLTKRRLALAAAPLVKAFRVMILDSGSTTAAVASVVEPETLVYTNSIAALQPLAKVGATIRLAPGHYIPSMAAVFGEDTEVYFRHLTAPVLFLSSYKLDVKNGLFNINPITVSVKRAMMAAAKHVVVVATHDKFCYDSVQGFAGLDQVDTLITDRVPDEFREPLQRYAHLRVITSE